VLLKGDKRQSLM